MLKLFNNRIVIFATLSLFLSGCAFFEVPEETAFKSLSKPIPFIETEKGDYASSDDYFNNYSNVLSAVRSGLRENRRK